MATRRKIINLSLNDEELAYIDELVEKLKKRGVKKVTRSSLFRFAVRTVDLRDLQTDEPVSPTTPSTPDKPSRLRACKRCRTLFYAQWPGSWYCPRCPAPGHVPVG